MSFMDAFLTSSFSAGSSLSDFWEPAGIPKDTKTSILDSVAALLGHSLEFEYDIWKLVEQAGELGLDVTTLPKRPGDTP